MAIYKNADYLVKQTGNAFDIEHKPGGGVKFSGIYKCMGCGREVVAEQSKIFPPQNHHQHSTYQGSIRWKLIVAANHEPS